MDYQGDTGGGYQQQAASPGGGGQQQRPRKAYDEQTLLPVTAAMLNKATSADGNHDLPDGRPIHHVKIVGAVRDFEEQSTHLSLQIEDSTGLVDVKQWLDDNDSSAAVELREQCKQPHIYVRVVGQVKDYNGQKSIVAHSVRRCFDSNEITHHFLEVVHSAESYKRADRIGGVAPPVSMNMSGMGHVSAPVKQQSADGAGNGLKDQILHFIKTRGGTYRIVCLFVYSVS